MRPWPSQTPSAPFRTRWNSKRAIVSCEVVLNAEVERLQCQVPLGDPSIGILHPFRSLKRFVICLQGGILYPGGNTGRSLFHCQIPNLPGEQFLADVGNWMAAPGEAQPPDPSICLQNNIFIKVWTVQNRFLTQLLDVVEGCHCLLCPLDRTATPGSSQVCE